MRIGARTTGDRLFAVGLVGVAIAAAAYGTLHVLLGPRPVGIHVRWAPDVDDFRRQVAERRYKLSQGALLEGRTWDYTLSDPSRTNVSALVTDPVIEDTQDIDRTAFRVSPSAPRRPYPPASHPWIPAGLRGVAVLCLFIGLGGIGLGFIERARYRAQTTTRSHRDPTNDRRLGKSAVLWSVFIVTCSCFALVIYELPHVHPSVQSTSWWIFLTPDTWDSNRTTKEFGLWENVTAVSFFVSGSILIATSVFRPFMSRNRMWVPFLFGVVYLVATAEEISLGQHFLEFATPESVRSLNSQGETNLHNMFDSDVSYFAVLLAFYAYIGVFPFAASYWQVARKWTLHLNIPQPPMAFAIIVTPAFMVCSADLVIGRWDPSLFGLREIREFVFALAILGTTIDWFSRNSVTPR